MWKETYIGVERKLYHGGKILIGVGKKVLQLPSFHIDSHGYQIEVRIDKCIRFGKSLFDEINQWHKLLSMKNFYISKSDIKYIKIKINVLSNL